MGWFGKGPMDGDIGMDFQSELFGFLKLNEDSSKELIKKTLESETDKILNWIRDFDWNKVNKENPGMYQFFYIQAMFQIFVDYNANISKRMYDGGVQFIIEDSWAKNDKERREIFETLHNNIRKLVITS